MTVKPLEAEFDWSDEKEFVYDGSEKTVTASLKNAVNDDLIVVTCENDKGTDAGEYLAKITGLQGDKVGNYIISDDDPNLEQKWKITRAPNKVKVSVEGWTYGDEAGIPEAEADFGIDTVKFMYSDAADGTYTETVPVNAGSYFVKAVIAGTDNYAGIESEPVSFEIAKAALTVTASNVEASYGSDFEDEGCTIEGLIDDETPDVLDGKAEYSAVDAEGNEYKAFDPAGEY